MQRFIDKTQYPSQIYTKKKPNIRIKQMRRNKTSNPRTVDRIREFWKGKGELCLQGEAIARASTLSFSHQIRSYSARSLFAPKRIYFDLPLWSFTIYKDNGVC